MVVAFADTYKIFTAKKLRERKQEEEERKRAVSVLRSSEVPLGAEDSGSGRVCEAALLSDNDPPDSPMPRYATEIPAIKGCESDLHTRPACKN
jgi:hypothetical protein